MEKATSGEVVIAACEKASCDCNACSKVHTTSPLVGRPIHPVLSQALLRSLGEVLYGFKTDTALEVVGTVSMVLSSSPFLFHCIVHSARFTCSPVSVR